MNPLVYLESDRQAIRPGSLAALGMAQSVARATGGTVSAVVIDQDPSTIAESAAEYCDVVSAKTPDDHCLADLAAHIISSVVRDGNHDMLVAAHNTTSKDLIARAGGLLGGAMASDVVAHTCEDGRLLYTRPTHAGSILTTIELLDTPHIVTVRATSYDGAERAAAAGSIRQWEYGPLPIDSRAKFIDAEVKQGGRPDVAEARVVVSGGRAIKTSDDFERLVGGLADLLHGATGSSRALVDAGIAPNEMQVGQTGKVVAPELYVALGISGAVQHLAGMKNSKVVVAINSDPDAPIFEMADYGLVGDIYDLVPQWIAHATR